MSAENKRKGISKEMYGCLGTIVAALITGICVLIVGLPTLISFFKPDPTATAIPSPFESQSIRPTFTPLSTVASAVTDPIGATNTSLPTQTPPPTHTPNPTNTPKPSISLPFEDGFSSGINPPWSVYSGQWMTTDNGATITITDDDPRAGALILDDPGLTNYRLRVDVHSPGVLSACQGNLGVIVRYRPERDRHLIFFMNSASRFYWGYTAGLSPDFGSVSPVTDVKKANIISDFIMELDASGNTFTARVNGEKYDSFTLTGYESGGVVLIPVCGCPGYCPSFSNLSLEPLP